MPENKTGREYRTGWEYKTGLRIWLLGSAVLFSNPLILATARAADRHTGTAPKPTATIPAHPINMHSFSTSGATVSLAMQPTWHSSKRGATRSNGISCVPYARQVSGIEVTGNAWQWWENASGLYARGDRPEIGSVLNFRSNGRMHLGHVAVVRRIINAREVTVDQANWPSGGRVGAVSHDVAIVDVSEANNWSAVRVELDRDRSFGSVYPTYGFIYNRPDTGVVLASVARPVPQPDINPVPSDLRPKAERPWHTVEEVAESPATPSRGFSARVSPATTLSGN
jgi:surface antigen